MTKFKTFILGEAALKLGGFGGNKAKATKVVDAFYDKYPSNPMNPKEFYIQQGNSIALVEMYADPEGIWLKFIRSMPGNDGLGTKVMHEIIDAAKKAGVPIWLQAWEDGPVKKAKLVSWYKKLGFTGTANKMTYKP